MVLWLGAAAAGTVGRGRSVNWMLGTCISVHSCTGRSVAAMLLQLRVAALPIHLGNEALLLPKYPDVKLRWCSHAQERTPHVHESAHTCQRVQIRHADSTEVCTLDNAPQRVPSRQALGAPGVCRYANCLDTVSGIVSTEGPHLLQARPLGPLGHLVTQCMSSVAHAAAALGSDSRERFTTPHAS